MASTNQSLSVGVYTGTAYTEDCLADYPSIKCQNPGVDVLTLYTVLKFAGITPTFIPLRNDQSARSTITNGNADAIGLTMNTETLYNLSNVATPLPIVQDRLLLMTLLETHRKGDTFAMIDVFSPNVLMMCLFLKALFAFQRSTKRRVPASYLYPQILGGTERACSIVFLGVYGKLLAIQFQQFRTSEVTGPYDVELALDCLEAQRCRLVVDHYGLQEIIQSNVTHGSVRMLRDATSRNPPKVLGSDQSIAAIITNMEQILKEGQYPIYVMFETWWSLNKHSPHAKKVRILRDTMDTVYAFCLLLDNSMDPALLHNVRMAFSAGSTDDLYFALLQRNRPNFWASRVLTEDEDDVTDDEKDVGACHPLSMWDLFGIFGVLIFVNSLGAVVLFFEILVCKTSWFGTGLASNVTRCRYSRDPKEELKLLGKVMEQHGVVEGAASAMQFHAMLSSGDPDVTKMLRAYLVQGDPQE